MQIYSNTQINNLGIKYFIFINDTFRQWGGGGTKKIHLKENSDKAPCCFRLD